MFGDTDKTTRKGGEPVNAGARNGRGLVWEDNVQSLAPINDLEQGVTFWGSLLVDGI